MPMVRVRVFAKLRSKVLFGAYFCEQHDVRRFTL